MANPNNALKALRERKSTVIFQTRFSHAGQARAEVDKLRLTYKKPRYVVRMTTQTLHYCAKPHRPAYHVHYYWVRVYECDA